MSIPKMIYRFFKSKINKEFSKEKFDKLDKIYYLIL